jgi:hypothetical protein
VKPIARLVAIAGAIGLGYFLLSASPRDVVLVYDLGAEPVASLDVDIRRGGEVVRHAELSARGASQVRHPVRLPDGDYVVAWQLAGPGGLRSGERTLTVREDGTIVLSLGR